MRLMCRLDGKGQRVAAIGMEGGYGVQVGGACGEGLYGRRAQYNSV